MGTVGSGSFHLENGGSINRRTHSLLFDLRRKQLWGVNAMVFRWATWFLGLLITAQAWAQAVTSPTAIFVMKPDGSDVRKMAEVEGHDDHEAPRWSHDAKHLVFDARNVASRERTCFVVRADGTELREVAKGRFADWSPDDRQITFQVDGDDGSSQIYVQNLDGKGLTRIGEGRSPRWSIAGNVLVYTDGTMLRALDLLNDERTALLPAPVTKVFDGLAWSPDGKSMAVVVRQAEGAPRQLFFVDPSGNNRELKPRLINEMGGFTSFSPDGKQLVFSDGTEIRLVDVAGDTAARKVPGQVGMSKDPAFSPDGKWIAFASSRRVLAPATQAAMPTAKRLQEVRRHNRRSVVWSLDFTPDGRSAVLGGANGSGVQVWDLTNGETRDLGGRGMLVNVFPDGGRFATSWVEPVAHVIDLKSGEVLKEFDHGGRIWAFFLSPDGRRLLTGGLDKVIRIWDADSGNLIKAFDPLPDYVTRATFSPDSKEVIAGCHDKKLRVFDAETGKQRLAIDHPAALWGLAVSPDGRHILTGTGGSLVGSLTGLNIGEGDDCVLRMWNSETGKLVREMKGHEGGVFCIDVSPDGRLAATGGADGTLRLWDLSTGDELSKIGPAKGIVACARFSPDGKLIVAGGGISRIAGQTIEFPNEQIRVFKVLDASEAAAAEAESK
jgi:WD40 repeat protein